MSPIVAEVSGVVHADLATSFAVFANADLTSILRGFGPLPAVTSVEKQTGPWNEVGQTRELHLADGSRMREELTRVDAPGSFEYVVDGFTGAVRHLVREMHGRWSFDVVQGEPEQTRASWRYEFHCTNALATLPSIPIVRWLWTPVMQQALELSSEQAAVARKSDRGRLPG